MRSTPRTTFLDSLAWPWIAAPRIICSIVCSFPVLPLPSDLDALANWPSSVARPPQLGRALAPEAPRLLQLEAIAPTQRSILQTPAIPIAAKVPPALVREQCSILPPINPSSFWYPLLIMKCCTSTRVTLACLPSSFWRIFSLILNDLRNHLLAYPVHPRSNLTIPQQINTMRPLHNFKIMTTACSALPELSALDTIEFLQWYSAFHLLFVQVPLSLPASLSLICFLFLVA